MGNSINLSKEQKQVIDIKDKNVLVAASAGSGKTFVVVERIVNRVINDKLDIDKILVVTFTNAAASELKERIIKRLYEILRNNNISDDDKKHIRKQLTLINRAQISTIHSFCLSVIKNNFYKLGIEPNVKTLDENKEKLMILESIDEVIQQEYENKSENFLKVLDIFKSEENLVEYIEKTYKFARSMVDPILWLEDSRKKYKLNSNIKDLSEVDFGKQVIENIKERLEIISIELENICIKMQGDKDFQSRYDILNNILEKIETMSCFNLYDELYDFCHNELSFPRLPNSRCANEELKKEVSEIKKKVTGELDNISKMIYKNTKGIIEELNSISFAIDWIVDISLKVNYIYTNKKNVSGQIDFNDYEHLALKALEDEEVRQEYINKFDEIYIDEYQDTSYIQETILKKISKNNRIMVGDVKQSIYSFRNAMPELFNEKYNRYNLYNTNSEEDVKEAKIILSRNFRSRKCVLDSINDVFKKVMSDKVGQCEYNENEFLAYGDGYDMSQEKNNITEINILESENYEQDSLVENEIEEISNIEKEATIIADKINDLIKSEFKIYDLKRKEYRNIQYKDIVILLRSVNLKADLYEKILKSHNIPCFSDTSESFYNGQEVSLILSLLKVVDNIYDDISLVSVMYSIIGKFTLDDLVAIRQYDKKNYLYNSLIKAYNDEKIKDTILYTKLENFLKYLNKLEVYVNTYTISETLLKIYEETGVYYSLRLEEMGNQKCANLDSLVEIAKNFEKQEKSSIYEFITYIENIKQKKIKGSDTPKLLGEGENVVRILTIHKSKGLEFPIVILANASKKYNIMDANAELLFDRQFGIGIDIYNTDLGISYASVIKQAIKENIKNKTLSEEERLLYVAMTRAKEKLFVYGTVKNYDKFTQSILTSKGNQLSSIMVKECNNYLKLIMMALKSQDTNNFKVNKIIYDNKINENVKLNNDINRDISIKDKFLNICGKNNLEKQKINTDFEKQYNYIDSMQIKKKYTVSEIKSGKYDKEIENYDSILNEENNNKFEELKPKSLNSNLSSLNYGTIVHRILEYLDYTNLNTQNIDDLVSSVCKDAGAINVSSIKRQILNYINSDIKYIIKDAKQIRKEQPFVIFDDLNNIDKINLKEKSFIQGVIDLYIITSDNRNIIVDFKTDNVKDTQELIEKYKVQLEIYKKGIELSLNKEVDSMYIYSFNLNKLIRI